MANMDIILPTGATRELPAVRSIGVRDLRDALAMGLAGFLGHANACHFSWA